MSNPSSTDDLVKRLREAAILDNGLSIDRGSQSHAFSGMLADEAADALLSLSRRCEEAKRALQPFAKLVGQWSDRLPDDARIGGSQVFTDGGPLDLRFEHEYTMGDLRRASDVGHGFSSPSPASEWQGIETLGFGIEEDIIVTTDGGFSWIIDCDKDMDGAWVVQSNKHQEEHTGRVTHWKLLGPLPPLLSQDDREKEKS